MVSKEKGHNSLLDKKDSADLEFYPIEGEKEDVGDDDRTSDSRKSDYIYNKFVKDLLDKDQPADLEFDQIKETVDEVWDKSDESTINISDHSYIQLVARLDVSGEGLPETDDKDIHTSGKQPTQKEMINAIHEKIIHTPRK